MTDRGQGKLPQPHRVCRLGLVDRHETEMLIEAARGRSGTEADAGEPDGGTVESPGDKGPANTKLAVIEIDIEMADAPGDFAYVRVPVEAAEADQTCAIEGTDKAFTRTVKAVLA